MDIDNAQKNDIKLLVEQALEFPDVDRFEIDIFSNSKNSDGYLGDILFADVVAESRNGSKRTYNLVLKLGKQNDYFRSLFPVSEIYNHEIFMYNNVFPYYDKFQREKGLGGLDFVPKCYKTYSKCDREMLVLENLKQIGYEIHNQRQPMNLGHISAALKTYGKWHALSFAVNDQKPNDFENLTCGMKNLAASFVDNKEAATVYATCIQMLKDLLQEHGENKLLAAFNSVLGDCAIKTYGKLITAKESQAVLTHGDCWNNNLMFKYTGTSKTSPSKVVIIDWQMSHPRSPVFDLSYFIYLVTTKNELSYFDEMLYTYYSSFSEHLRKLGSDPDQLFPLEDLMEHWRKYSLYGLLTAPMTLRYCLCEAEDAPNFSELTEDTDIAEMAHVEVKDKEQYYSRLKDILTQYLSFQDLI